MAIWQCPGCGENLMAPDSDKALKLRCTRCGQVFQTMPASAATAAAPPAPRTSAKTESAAPTPRKQPRQVPTATKMPKKAIAVMVFCGCAVLAAIAYAVMAPPADPGVADDLRAISEKDPAPKPAPKPEPNPTPPGPVVAVAPTPPPVPAPKPVAPPAPSPFMPPEPVAPPAPEPVTPPEPAAPPAPEPAPITPPEPEPAPEPAPKKPVVATDPLVQVAAALEAGRVEAADGMMTAMDEKQKQDPLFQLAVAYRHIVESDNAAATKALRQAVETDPALADARLLLAGSLVIGGRGTDAIYQINEGRKYAPEDVRFTYTEGLAQFRLRKYEESKTAFDAASDAPGELGRLAKEHAAMVAGLKSTLDEIKTVEDNLKEKLDGLQAELKDKIAVQTAAKKKQTDLKNDMYRREADIKRDYSRKRQQAYDQYNRDSRYRNNSTRDGRYNRNRTDPRRRRDEALRKAASERDQAMRKLASDYKAKMAPINREVNQVTNEVISLRKKQAGFSKERGQLVLKRNTAFRTQTIDYTDDVRRALVLKADRMRELVRQRRAPKAPKAVEAKVGPAPAATVAGGKPPAG